MSESKVVQHTPGPFRHIHRHEWKYMWHYARYDRRHGQVTEVGFLLRKAARDVMHQKRDPLAVRAAMHAYCHPLSAVLATTQELRSTFAKATGSES